MWVCLISICKYLLTQGGTLGRDYENSLYCKSFSIKKKSGMQDVQLLREGGCKTVRVIACLIQRMLFTAS